MGEFILQPCVPADVPAMVEIYIAAFESNVLNQVWAPASKVSDKDMASWLSARFTRIFAKREMVLTKAVEVSTGTVAAWTRWTYPYTLTEEEKSERKARDEEEKLMRAENRGDLPPDWPIGANSQAAEELFGSLHAMEEKYVDTSQYYVCHLLATSPKFQRKGLATLLLKHGLDKADAAGKTSYIEASEAGHSLYARLGWEDVDIIELDYKKYGEERRAVNWIMLRAPKVKELAV